MTFQLFNPIHNKNKMKITFALKWFVIFIVGMFLISENLTAQLSGGNFNWEIGISGGGSRFLNSINPNSDALYKKFNYWNCDWNSATSVSVIRNLTNIFCAEVEWQSSKLSGNWNMKNNYGIPPRAIVIGLPYPDPFKTGVNEFDLNLIVNLNKLIIPDLTNDRWYLFVKGGAGGVLIKEYSALFPYSTSGNPFKYSIVYGTGLTYLINDKIKLKLGCTWHKVETDRLDGVHTVRAVAPYDAYFNVKETYLNCYMGLTIGFGKFIISKHQYHGIGRRFLWFQPSARNHK